MFRDAFRNTVLYEHKSASSSISTLALNSRDLRLYIGLTDGHLEEYTLNRTASVSGIHLSARKLVSKRVGLLRAFYSLIHVGIA